jgi:uncharacterized protein YneF (UPF0154 family)
MASAFGLDALPYAPLLTVLCYLCLGFIAGAYFTSKRKPARTMNASADKLSEEQKRQLMSDVPSKVSRSMRRHMPRISGCYLVLL